MALDRQFQTVHAFGMYAVFMIPMDKARKHGVWKNNKAFVSELRFANKGHLTIAKWK